jgi:beta-lactamase regulating signal transducer with metallopeptidase domain
MAGIFLKIVNMSISACWIVLAILLLRIILKKAPKWINCVLWGIAGLRLVMPFSFESIFSLIPSAETITKVPDSPRPHIDSGVSVIDNQVNDYLQGNYFEGVSRPMGNFIDITTMLAIVWVVGIVALLIYTLVSFSRLKSKIGTAVLLRDNIYQSEAVVSPFVLGIINPKIYLPFNMNEQNMEHVIAHEQAHILRKDHLWKPLGFLILTLHWFNPMVWLGYILLCRDIELACDEKVVKELNNEQRANYSQALLTCSINRRMIAACPLAFGEVGVKDRVKSVLNYKKPAFWIIIVAIITSIAVAVCFLTNPKKNTELSEIQNGTYKLSNEIYFNGSYSYIPYIENNRIEIKTKGGMHIYHFIGEELSTGALYEEVSLNKENFSDLFDNIEIWSDNQNHNDLLKNNKKAWFHNTPDDIGGYPYMLLLQKDGTLYMTFVDFKNGEPTTVRYIYELDYTSNVENGYYMVVNDFTEKILNSEYADKYMAIHYSTEEETNKPGINIGEVYGKDLIEYLNSRQWKSCSTPWNDLSSPGSVEFIISDDYRITVYEKKSILSKAYAVVTENGEKTYYKAQADDYSSAKSILKTPDLTSTKENTSINPSNQVYDNEDFVIQKLHYKNTDGNWVCEEYTYKYRLEITGRLNNANKNTTYIVLSNRKDITFDETWKASGLSSNTADYFDPTDAVIVGHKLFD